MTTNKTRRTKKRHSKKKDITKTSHRNRRHRSRHRSRHRNRSSWKNHYTYESYAPETNNIVNGNNGNIVNGLRDFLALKKDKK